MHTSYGSNAIGRGIREVCRKLNVEAEAESGRQARMAFSGAHISARLNSLFLYPTDGLDLHLDLNQILFGLFVTYPNSSTKFCPNPSTTF